MHDKARIFFDSNIIIYSYDSHALEKHKKANDLLEQSLTENNGCISAQVIQECLNVFTSKARFAMTSREARECLEVTLAPLLKPLPPLPLCFKALEIQEQRKVSFYDSLIIAAALQLGCTMLYTEDMQHGQRINGLKIVNPFTK